MTAHDKDAQEQRKEQLLAEARLHRAAIVLAKQHIKHGARPEVIVHNALDHATYAVRTRLDALLTPAGLSVTAVAPYALRAFSYLRRRGQLKPALGVAALLAGAGWYLHHRRQQHHSLPH